MTWKRLTCKYSEVQLIGTLNGGQSFRWTLDSKNNEWTGTFAGTVWRLLQDDEGISYKILGTLRQEESKTISEITTKTKVKKKNIKKSKAGDSVQNSEINDDSYFENLLLKYFRLDVDLAELYEDWSKKDEFFGKAAKQFYGIRMLDQEPVENLFSFICSQNNHISRISTMIEKLCVNYGEEICEVDGNTYFSFPCVENISGNKVEAKLRELGFGYRAKFIQQSAALIQQWGGQDWFSGLERLPYKEAKLELVKLPGIGPKVADCVCLMSLNHLEALPVDTHVYQIASQNYLPHLRGFKSVTDRVYTEIGDHFRTLYGPLAGWAHTVLFCADLKKFEQPGVKRVSASKPCKTAAKKPKKPANKKT